MINPSSSPRIGVIDIGSNSVRLVIYDGLKRVPIPLFNEKVLCGLARNLSKTGTLHPEGVELARKSLARFIRITGAMGVGRLEVFATAAVRDAKDGKSFVASLNKKYNISITIFPGEKEAEYAGLGVLACMPDAEGMVGDLGGGSLELAHIHGGRVDSFSSYPIGLLRLLSECDGNKEKAITIINQYLEEVPLLSAVKKQRFYAVGGGFRNLAKIHIALTHYPLRILHHYVVSAHTFRPVLQRIADMNSYTLQRMSDVSGKRAETLPYTALLLDRIIATAEPTEIVFSAYGIREGFLFAELSKKIQQEDPLIAGCSDIIQHIGETSAYGYELCQWMDELFPDESPAIRRLRLAACILSGLARYEHTEYRAEIAFRRFLDSSITGIDHPSRLFIARALYHRYSTVSDKTITGITDPLLDAEDIHTAKIIGLTMRLAHNISAGTTGILPHTRLSIEKDRLILAFSPQSAEFMGEAVQKRLDKLANLLKLKPIVMV